MEKPTIQYSFCVSTSQSENIATLIFFQIFLYDQGFFIFFVCTALTHGKLFINLHEWFHLPSIYVIF